jgi:hypothetical protein
MVRKARKSLIRDGLYNMVQFRAPLVGPSLAPMDNRQEDTSVEVFATTTHSSEGVDSKTLDDVVDARIDSSRPSPGELDLGLAQQLSNLVQRVASRPHSKDSTVKEKIEEPIYVSPFCIRCLVLFIPS